MTGDCVGLGIDRAGRLIQTKPAYGGNIVSVIMGATTPQLATVRTQHVPAASRRATSSRRGALAAELPAIGWPAIERTDRAPHATSTRPT
jgi:electron transfer flavoprotein alpha subunit